MNSNLIALLQLSDPTLPIGGYAHSAGLETYVQSGIVHNLSSAKEFVTGMLTNNLRFTDAAFVSLAYRAAQENDLDKIILLDNECTAVKLPKEMRQASRQMGNRLIKIFKAVCKTEMTEQYLQAISADKITGNYSIAFGLYAQALQINLKEALTGFYYNAATGLVTNCVKLIPLGQQHGQELLFSLQTLIGELAEKSLEPDKSLIGLCCSGFDIRSMQHERLYSRLYMS